MNYLLPERLDRLAREYALGTLTGPARRRFERVLQQSAAARVAVGVWQERLALLEAGAPAVQPRPAVWQGLVRRIDAGAAAPGLAGGWWAGLRGLWSGRPLGGALAGVVLCVAVLRLQPGLLGLEPHADSLPPSYVGLLTDANGLPAVLASSYRQGRKLTVKLLRPVDVPAGRVAQLWALPQDGGAPFPVAVVPATGSAVLALSDTSEKLFSKVSRLAVSFEAAPAKPGDRPGADFVLSGHCVKLW
jgi:anti-sigma-K factor RskA